MKGAPKNLKPQLKIKLYKYAFRWYKKQAGAELCQAKHSLSELPTNLRLATNLLTLQASFVSHVSK